MYTPEWIMAAGVQGISTLIGFIISVAILRIKFSTALLTALLCNSLPVGKPPGFGTPFMMHDVVLPIILLLAAFGRPRHTGTLCWLAMFTAFLWPAVGTLAALLQGNETMVWVTFLFRRFAMAIYFVAGAGVSIKKIRARDVLDTCVAIWLGMAVAGTLQYLGLISIDPSVGDTSGGESIEESSTAQRGFLGMNRGAVGVWSSAFLGYSLTHIVLNRDLGIARLMLHTVSIAATVVVVLFSGSRTGTLACAVSAGYVALRSIPLLHYTKPARLLLFGALGLIAAQPILAKGAATISKRLESFQDLDRLGSFQERVEVQTSTIKFILTNAQAALIGMGPELVRFRYYVSADLKHPHSEYVFMLWLSGVPGLLLYLCMLAAFYYALRQTRSASLNVNAIAGQTILVAGAVMGLAVGFVLTTGVRLAGFGMLMLFILGLLIRESAAQRAEASPTFDSQFDYLQRY